MNQQLFAMAWLAMLLDQPLAAQEATLDPVLVTAHRVATEVEQTPASVTFITRADLERLQPRSISDLLLGQAGIAITQSGGLGQPTSLFMRGSNANHTLLLIDGVRVANVGFGLPAYEQIPVDQIDHIEIVRGPRASLYGADAIGGVIQIFTRHGAAAGGFSPSFSLTGGSQHYLDGHAGVSAGDQHTWINANVGGQYARGIPACRGSAGVFGYGCGVNDTAPDGFRHWNGAGNVGHRFASGAEWSLNVLRSSSDVAYAGTPAGGNFAHNTQEVIGTRFSFEPLAFWQIMLTGGSNRDNNQRYFQGYYPGDVYGSPARYYAMANVGYTEGRRRQLGWQNSFALNADQQLVAGVDWQQERIGSDTTYLKSRRDNTGAYLEYLDQFGRHRLEFAVRRDHNEQFGHYTTGSAAWAYDLGAGLRLSASYGSAFHAPSLNDIYYPYGLGNPALKPERAHSTELGLAQRRDDWRWSVNAYETRIRDLILATAASRYVPENIAEARLRGLETQVGTTLGEWQIHGTLTLQQSHNTSAGSNEGKLLPRRPERMGRIDLDRRFGDFGIGTTFYAASFRYDDLANQYRLGGYTTTDFRASWRFAPHWQLQSRLANAFAKRYETAYYYNQLGRTWYLTVRYSPATVQ